MIETLLRLALDRGADLAGFAAFDRGELALYSLLDSTDAKRYHSAFVIAKKHDPEALDNLRGTPTEAYERDYRRLNKELYDEILFLENYLQERGIACLAVNPSQTLDRQSHRGLVSHRALAERAGIGIRGRNNLLVTQQYLSEVRLCSLLTELQVKKMPKLAWPHPCLECDNCRRACPVRAIGEKAEDYRLDLCLMHLERVKAEGISPQICGACLAACPRSNPKQQTPQA